MSLHIRPASVTKYFSVLIGVRPLTYNIPSSCLLLYRRSGCVVCSGSSVFLSEIPSNIYYGWVLLILYLNLEKCFNLWQKLLLWNTITSQMINLINQLLSILFYCPKIRLLYVKHCFIIRCILPTNRLGQTLLILTGNNLILGSICRIQRILFW